MLCTRPGTEPDEKLTRASESAERLFRDHLSSRSSYAGMRNRAHYSTAAKCRYTVKWGLDAAYRTAYNASKAAIIRFTEDLPLELAGTNIQVNVMGPGTQRTRLVEEMWEGVAAAGVTERFEATRRQMFDQVVAKFGASAAVSMERATDLAVFLGSDASGQLRCEIAAVNRHRG